MMMMLLPAISAALGLKRYLHFYELCAKAGEHLFDHMVRPNAKNLVMNFCRQMPVSQMPRQSHKLTAVLMPDFNDKFRCGLNPEPSSIVKLQAVAVCHSNGVWKIKQQILAKIVNQTTAAAVSVVKVQSKRAHSSIVGPLPGRPMCVSMRKESVDSSHIST